MDTNQDHTIQAKQESEVGLTLPAISLCYRSASSTMTVGARLIAHRGAMRDYPENTLLALQAAVTAGAQFVEFDVQLSADGVPVLLHDETFKRTASRPGRVMDLTASELIQLPAHYPARFGEAHAGEKIPTLAQVVAALNGTPYITTFVEAKRQSLAYFGVRLCIDRIMLDMQLAQFPWVLISFVREAVEYARAHHGNTIGWILSQHDERSRKTLELTQPNYVFGNIDLVSDPTHGLWPGPWKWVIYDIDNAQQARRLLKAGADLIETCCIRDLMDEMRRNNA